MFIYNDGGRSNYFKTTNVGDCVTRAICNATGMDYKEVYNTLNRMAKSEDTTNHRGHKQSSSRNGVFKETWKTFLDQIGWKKVKCAGFGQKYKLHLPDDLPKKGTYIVQVSKHLTVYKDGNLIDTYDCSRDGSRMVYGFWYNPNVDEENVQETLAWLQDIRTYGIRRRFTL